MEEKNPLSGAERLPGEVVEVYRPRDRREVVEVYSRPLPGAEKPERKIRESTRRRRKTGLWVFLLLILLAAALALGTWIYTGWNDGEDEEPEFGHSYEQENTEITIPAYPWGDGTELWLNREPGETLTPQEVYRRVNPAVVMVLGQLKDGTSMGTGVLFTEDGYILTNHHVVAGSFDCMVVLENNQAFPAFYVAGDADNDLAVLKADLSNLPPMQTLPTAEFGDSDLLTVGDPVYAIGNPLNANLRGTFTNGIVSAIDRDVEVDGRTMNLIQTNAALNSGNSGGPLINEQGQVVGINVIKMMSSRDDTVEGLGFAIPSAAIERLVNDLLTYGAVQPEPRLGMSVLQAGVDLGDGLRGVEVVVVSPGTAAEEAGMQVGDYVVQVGEVPVSQSRDVFRARRQYHIGDRMTITVWREGELIDLTLELTEAFE